MSVSQFICGVAAAGVLLVACASDTRASVTFGQLDSFQDGTTMGWREGLPSPNAPDNVAGGPGGEADLFLRNVSSTADTAGSRIVMFNEAQWAGDYNAAGVTRVDATLANLGAAPLYMRLAIQSSGGTRYASRTAVVLQPGEGWRGVSFDLTPAAMAPAGGFGSETLAATLSSVRTVRLLSAESAPAWIGDPIDGTLGTDNLRALRLPGDADFDGTVDVADQLLVRNHLGDSGAGVDWRAGDFNFDGRVDARDLVLLRRNFGQSVAAAGAAAAPAAAGAAAVSPLPDPAGGASVLLGAVAVLARRPARPRHGTRAPTGGGRRRARRPRATAHASVPSGLDVAHHVHVVLEVKVLRPRAGAGDAVVHDHEIRVGQDAAVVVAHRVEAHVVPAAAGVVATVDARLVVDLEPELRRARLERTGRRRG